MKGKTGTIIIVSVLILLVVVLLIVFLRKKRAQTQTSTAPEERKPLSPIGFDWKFEPRPQKDEPKKDVFGNIITKKDAFGKIINQQCFPKDWKWSYIAQKCEPPRPLPTL